MATITIELAPVDFDMLLDLTAGTGYTAEQVAGYAAMKGLREMAIDGAEEAKYQLNHLLE